MPKCFPLFLLLALLAVTVSAAEDEEPSNLDPLIEVLGQVDDAAFQLDVLKGIHDAVKGRRKLTTPKSWPMVSQKLAKSPDAKVRELTQLLSLLFGDQATIQRLRKRVRNRKEKKTNRASALRALVQIQDAKLLDVLLVLLDEPAMRGEALRGLAGYSDARIPKAILATYPKLTSIEKQDALGTLASRLRYVFALLDAMERKQIPSRDLSAFTARQLADLGNKKITARLEKVWGSVRPAAKDKVAKIASLKNQLGTDVLAKGNAMHGRLVFSKTCAACHVLFGEGRKVGPELTGAQRNNLDYVLLNLVDPNSAVGRDFRITIIVTDAGRSVAGIIVAENEGSVTIRTANDDVTIPLDEIDIRKRSAVSMMPEGMLDKLTPEQIRDLVVYLASPTQVPLPKQPTQK